MRNCYLQHISQRINIKFLLAMTSCIVLCLVTLLGCNTHFLLGKKITATHDILNLFSDHDVYSSAFISTHNFTDNSVMVHEINDFSYILPDGEMTQDLNNVYVFDKIISLEDRENFILNQNILFGDLAKYGIYDEDNHFTMFLSEKYINRSDSDKAMGFFLNSSVGSWEQILITIQMIEGDDINYGYAYAKANLLANNLGWKTDIFDTLSDDEIIAELHKDEGRINLVYPCFLITYSTSSQIDLAKTISLKVADSLGDEFTEGEYLVALQEYAKNINIEYKETAIKFSNGGVSVPLIIKTTYIEELVTNDFSEDFEYLMAEFPVPDEINWQKNISEMIRLRELTDQTIEKARKSLDFTDNARRIVIWFQWEEGTFHRGLYSYNNDLITVNSVYVIAHEYIHYMQFQMRPNFALNHINWCTEAMALYYSRDMEYETSECLRAIQGLNSLDRSEYEQKSVDYILKRIESMNMSPTEIILMGETDITKAYYGCYYLIGDYIVRTYGENTFPELMLFPENADILVGKSIDQIIEEWDEYVRVETGYKD